MLEAYSDNGEETDAVSKRTIIVQKYGGSSVADVAKLGRVADRVVATRRAGHDVVVVVSAMGKTTDGLLALAEQARASGSSATQEPPRRELDMLVSTGERVTMALLSIAIQARGCDAISFTGSQSGIITNDRHFDARIIEVRPHRIEDELARGRIVIVAGYQGMSYKREITTLGRGGSDTTAVALAAALKAECCEIYSDVDGVYSADPRQLADARHLPEIDYDRLQEMADSGAKVLCAQAVEWARRAQIAIFARTSSDKPSEVSRQTIVRQDQPSDQPKARAVTADKKVALLTTKPSDWSGWIVDLLRGSGVSVRTMSTSAEGLCVILSLLNASSWSTLREKLTKSDQLRLVEDIAMVSVVGDGLTECLGTLGELDELLNSSGLRAHAWFGSALRLSVVVDDEQALEVQRLLHQRFV